MQMVKLLSTHRLARALGLDYRQIQRMAEIGLIRPQAEVDGRLAYSLDEVKLAASRLMELTNTPNK
jgi:hypothetical protein